MVRPLDWTALQSRVDYIVDGRFGEPVILIPWLGGQNYTPAQQAPDRSRKVVATTGMFVTPGANLVGESGRATGGSGGGFGTQLLEQEVWLSITSDKINGVRYWKAYDRVYFPRRDRFYNIQYVEDSATLRPNIHLIIEHDITTSQGSPLTVVTPQKMYDLYFDIFGNKFYQARGMTANDWVKL